MAIDQATKSHVLMRTRAKICGITRSQDILSVVQAGADAIGFVFFHQVRVMLAQRKHSNSSKIFRRMYKQWVYL